MANTEKSDKLETTSVGPGLENVPTSGRAEIDTSAPFESVKEAANLFGGMGFWKPSSSHKPISENAFERSHGAMIDLVKLEEQAALLERDLISKESETLDVLKELETTKNTVEELKLKLQKEATEISAALVKTNVNFIAEVPEKENHETVHPNVLGSLDLCPSEAPSFILMELKQAKLNLATTTTDLADIRATVESYNKKIEKERASLERTRQRLSSNTSKILSLEDELNKTREKLEVVEGTEVVVKDSCDDPLNITNELQKLSSETEQFKKVGEAARSEVVRAMSEIEQTKIRIRTAEISLIAAKKMKEAARASEAMARAEIKALSNSENKFEDVVTLTFEEYSLLISKACEAEQGCKNKVVDAMVRVDEANLSKMEMLQKVEEANEEVKISKEALEEVLCRVEEANRCKLAVEEALRVWRSEHGHKRRSVQNDTKFKNSSQPSIHRKEEPCLVDVNGLSLVSDEVKPVLKTTLSIGQILSRKLLLNEEYENGGMGKRKVSLGQMLTKPGDDDPHCGKKTGKENKGVSSKRKKFGFSRISLFVTKQSKKKKKRQDASSMCTSS